MTLPKENSIWNVDRSNSSAEAIKTQKPKSYYYAFFILITAIIITTFFASYRLTGQANSVISIVNISGQERLLSQQIMLYAHMMVMEKNVKKRSFLKDKLQDVINHLENTHYYLTTVSQSSAPSMTMSKTVQGLYFSDEHGIDKVVSDYISHARLLLANWKGALKDDPNLTYILDNGPTSVIEKMDVLVAQYQKEGEESLDLISDFEEVALSLGFFLLLVELFFIFRPLLTYIKEQHNELGESISSAHEFAHISAQLRDALNKHSLVSVTDVKGNIIYANEKFCQISGYTLSELTNANHRILKSNVQDEDFYKNLWKTIGAGRVWNGEICNLSKSGKPYWVQSTIVPFLDKNTQKPLQYVSITTEVSQQKEMQEKLDDLFMEAMSASEAKSSFIANMSHELRTPLNHIIGFSQIIEINTKDPEILESTEYIKLAGQDLLEKVNNILEFVSQEGPRAKKLQTFDIVGLIKIEFLNYFRLLAHKSKNKFTENIPNQEIYVAANSLELLTAFRKIARNAVLHSSEGDLVGISVTTSDDMVTVAIFDTGPGIPEHILLNSLEPFTIGEEIITKKNGGIGLGLPLAKKLCETNGGEFEIEDNNDMGTKIYFSFPICHPQPQPPTMLPNNQNI